MATFYPRPCDSSPVDTPRLPFFLAATSHLKRHCASLALSAANLNNNSQSSFSNHAPCIMQNQRGGRGRQKNTPPPFVHADVCHFETERSGDRGASGRPRQTRSLHKFEPPEERTSANQPRPDTVQSNFNYANPRRHQRQRGSAG